MTRRERQRRRHNRHGPLGLALIVAATTAALGIVGAAAYVFQITAQTPSLDELRPVPKGTSSIVLASDGSRLGYVQSDEYRTPVRWRDMPVSLREATIAIEDENFYHHSGVDYQAILRAVVNDIKQGKTAEGGSTITQQLVRNTLIGQERTLKRKIREAKYAQELEKRYTKNQILNKYLNSVSYGTVGGQTAVGCEAAAQTYFSKHCKDLSLEESATLAGLPQAPSIYNPIKNRQGALERRNEVLKQMAKRGYITRSQARSSSSAPLGVHQGSLYSQIREPFFFDYVKDLLNEHYGVNTVRKGGLTIHTTIDPQLQREARNAIDSILNYPDDPSSAVVSIDPENGYIRAMASSSNYKHQQFNLAAQGHRQPGSAFKVMVLTTAINRGINPNSTSYVSKPLHIPIPGYGTWNVSTYDNTYGGRMSLVQATLKSDNTVYAQLDEDLGPNSVADTAHLLGIKTKLDGVPSEGLGGLRLGVSPLEMSGAYSTLAASGIRTDPIAIKSVSFPGKEVEQWGSSERKQVISDGVAYEVTKILEKNVQGGTGTNAQTGCPTAGKTGTTDNFNDAWFVGYTPKLATAVWVGYPNALREMASVHGISVAGGTFPAEIFGKYMTQAIAGQCEDFPKPKNPVKWVPFFGRYSKEGAVSSDSRDYNYSEGSSPSGGGYGQGYDKRLYGPGSGDNKKKGSSGNVGAGGKKGKTAPPSENQGPPAQTPPPTTPPTTPPAQPGAGGAGTGGTGAGGPTR